MDNLNKKYNQLLFKTYTMFFLLLLPFYIYTAFMIETKFTLKIVYILMQICFSIMFFSAVKNTILQMYLIKFRKTKEISISNNILNILIFIIFILSYMIIQYLWLTKKEFDGIFPLWILLVNLGIHYSPKKIFIDKSYIYLIGFISEWKDKKKNCSTEHVIKFSRCTAINMEAIVTCKLSDNTIIIYLRDGSKINLLGIYKNKDKIIKVLRSI